MFSDIKDIANHTSCLIAEKYGVNHPYYDGSILINKGSKNTLLYVSTTNRTAGKTSFYLLLCAELSRLLDRKTVFIVRKVADLKDFAHIYDDVASIYYENVQCVTKTVVKDTISSVKLGEYDIGYVVCLKKYVDIKKFSPIFSKVDLMILDEYQTEDGVYIRQEIEAFQSIYRSIARGGGKQIRDVMLLLYGNPVTLMNPYLLEFEIAPKYKKGVDYLIDKLWVAEFKVNQSAAEKIRNHPSSMLFGAVQTAYDCGEDFLIDDSVYMEKCSGKSDYIATICYGGKFFGIRRYIKTNNIHIGTKHDPSCKKILVFRENDRKQNYELIEKYDYTWRYIREAYKTGTLRFDTLEGKRIIFKLIGVDIYGE